MVLDLRGAHQHVHYLKARKCPLHVKAVPLEVLVLITIVVLLFIIVLIMVLDLVC